MGLPVQAKGIDPTPSTPAPKAKTDAKSAATSMTDKTKKTDTKVAATPPAPVKTTKVDTTTTTLTSDKLTKSDAKTTTASTSDKDKKTDAKVTASATSSDKSKTTVAKASDKGTPAPAPTSMSSSRPVTTSVASSRPTTSSSHTSHGTAGQRLARLTAYWSGEGDYYTGRGMSSTGVHLHEGHCAVDPRIIPYGSVVEIAGVGKYLAVDTGSAVISREAARETGHNPEERNALVIDIYFESRAEGERFSAGRAKFANITWTSPRSTASTQDVGTSTAAE